MKFSLLSLIPALLLCAADTKTEPVKVQKANYELAQRWTTAKVTQAGLRYPGHAALARRRPLLVQLRNQPRPSFHLVDPVKKTKAPIFDISKMAAMLTLITRTPYDAQHLPIRTIKFVKNDTVVEFDIQVEKDADINGKQTVIGGEQEGDMTQTTTAVNQDAGAAGPRRTRCGAAPNPRMRTLYFEYELATGKLTLPPEFTPEPRKPTWASMSPDEKTIVFARKNNLYMMDAANYALALKKSDDPAIKEIQLTTDGEEAFSYARHINGAERDQEQQQQESGRRRGDSATRPAAFRPITIAWSKDSKKFSRGPPR